MQTDSLFSVRKTVPMDCAVISRRVPQEGEHGAIFYRVQVNVMPYSMLAEFQHFMDVEVYHCSICDTYHVHEQNMETHMRKHRSQRCSSKVHPHGMADQATTVPAGAQARAHPQPQSPKPQQFTPRCTYPVQPGRLQPESQLLQP